jgi:hypothetical protein
MMVSTLVLGSGDGFICKTIFGTVVVLSAKQLAELGAVI